MRPEDLFEGHPEGAALLASVRGVAERLGGVEVRATKSQVAFRRRRGFAYVWRPGQYLTGGVAPAVLSIVLPRRDPSPRWKEVAHPSPRAWMHHLELHEPGDVDEEVIGWLREAADAASEGDGWGA